MIRFKKIIISLIVLSTCFSVFAQNNEREEEYLNFERNYNELLQSYYIKSNEKLLNERFPSSAFMPTSTTGSSTPDEVYRQRLNSIPSAVKLVYNSQVRNHIVYYLDRMNRSVGLMLGLSKYYFPIFEDILDSYGVPSELKYLVVIESAFRPKAVSKAGATGLWQFMYATGRTYDLRVNSIVDDRCDPIKSTIAAAKFLKNLYGIYGDWSLVLAAYNCGPGNVNKAMKRSGKNDFWEIYDFLPKETRNYVPAYIAATYVMNFYQEHGIRPVELTRPLDLVTDTVVVNKDIYFGQIQDVMNISVEELKDLNPQYKMDYIPGTQDKYSLRLPLKYVETFIEMEDSISNCNIEKYRPELAKKDDSLSSSTTTVMVDKTIYHKVRKNENWSSIARRYGVSVSDLRKWNSKIKKNKLQKGTLIAVKTKVAVAKENVIEKDEAEKSSSFAKDEMLEANSSASQQELTTSKQKADKINSKVSSNKKVEVSTKQSAQEDKSKKQDNTSKKQETPSKKQDTSSNEKQDTKKTNAKQETNSKAKGKNDTSKTHTIKSGETISAIAKKYNISEQKLMKLNGLNDQSVKKIRPGQKLKLK
ncbi:MAG: transglycosylase SLT domain-containing protein [Bacteroidales bacterium]|nr:transglycosylase SLT domain-containing protein [Candidatus Scybalousia scybalohippi]